MKKVLISISALIALASYAFMGETPAFADHHGKMGDFISVQELKSMIDSKDPNLILIGVLHNKKRYIPFNNAGYPIEGSYTVWRPDYSGKKSKEVVSENVDGVRISKEEMEKLLGKAGAKPESTIVVYSADAMHDAARVYWQIKLLGQENVKLLDGGVNAWQAAGYSDGDSEDLVDADKKTDYKAATYTPETSNVTIEQVIAALDNPEEWVVIDTRSVGEQKGEKTGSSAGAYGTGGLKGSLDIEWKQALNKDHTLKSKAELEEIYKDINGRKVITFCQSGVRSAHTQAVLKEVLGLEEVYNYDGSWIEFSYAASDAGKDVDPKLKETVKAHISNWKDYNDPI